MRRFDHRWFNRVAAEFCPFIAEYTGAPVNYVEIGCWEGASALWVAENVLTHPDSHGWGIDPYSAMLPRHSQAHMDERADIAARQLAGHLNWTWVRKPSLDALRSWSLPIDILYIDGRHEAPHVLMDFVMAWPLMNVGGLVVFDDYGIGQRKGFPCIPEAVRSVQQSFGSLIEPLGRCSRQAAFRVVKKDVDAGWFVDSRIDRSAPVVEVAEVIA